MKKFLFILLAICFVPLGAMKRFRRRKRSKSLILDNPGQNQSHTPPKKVSKKELRKIQAECFLRMTIALEIIASNRNSLSLLNDTSERAASDISEDDYSGGL